MIVEAMNGAMNGRMNGGTMTGTPKEIGNQFIDFDKYVQKELTATKAQIKEFFGTVTASTKGDFTCTICKNTLFEPRMCVKCQNARYCKICVDKHVDKNDDWKNPPKCLKCSKAIDTGNLKPDVMGKLNATMFSFQHKGNAVTIPYIDIAKYFTENVFRKEIDCLLECNTKFDSLEEAYKHFE